MSGWAIAFFALLAWHLPGAFLAWRLIYWQRRHIDALKESARLDALLADVRSAHTESYRTPTEEPDE